MAETKTETMIDPKNGFCRNTKTFHSMREPVPLPPSDEPISITDYAFSLFRSTSAASSPESTPFIIESVTGNRISFSDFVLQTRNLASSLQAIAPSLAKNQVAFILSPSIPQLPVLYFALLSLGVIVSPANPISSESEIGHQVQLSKPVIGFATSTTAHKLPSFPLGTVLIDSPEFKSMLSSPRGSHIKSVQAKINQSDTAAILYSSGTTGRVKGVELTHRNLIAVTSGFFHSRTPPEENAPHPVSLFTLPLFHVFGFFMLIRIAALGETLVLMEKFDFEKMLQAIEKYKVTSMPVAPPLVVALAKSELVNKYDLSSLQLVGCGGAPLGKEVSEKFKSRFPNTEIVQGFGMTETGGGASGMVGPEECKKLGSVGRIAAGLEAKIVNPADGNALPPGQEGELWLRGPIIMKGYVGDVESTAATLDSDGWLKTGDLCYFDSDGFLYIVDRLKELIKYNAYQVPPAELEHILQSNPQVADAAVVPYPDEEAGQIPMAFVVRKPGSSITESQVMDFVAKQVAPYKKVRRVAFISSIPRSAAGKILRRELVNHAVSAATSRL